MSRRKKKPAIQPTSLRLPQDLNGFLEQEAEERGAGWTKTLVILELIRQYKSYKDKKTAAIKTG